MWRRSGEKTELNKAGKMSSKRLKTKSKSEGCAGGEQQALGQQINKMVVVEGGEPCGHRSGLSRMSDLTGGGRCG
jgi:hypothetical protein